MNEYDSPNYHEHSYDKRAEGLILFGRIGLILIYIAFAVGYFTFCYLTRILAIFALCPLFLWMFVYFTWRLVSYDVYYEFRSGTMEVGRIWVKKGKRKKAPRLSFTVRHTEWVAPYDPRDPRLKGMRLYDYSSSSYAKDRICIAMNEGGRRYAVVIDPTPRLEALLVSYSNNPSGIGKMRSSTGNTEG
jgi:hypothetical protein